MTTRYWNFGIPMFAAIFTLLLPAFTSAGVKSRQPVAGATTTVDVHTPWGLRRYVCEIVGDACLIEGDVALSRPVKTKGAPVFAFASATPTLGERWPKGVVPYDMGFGFRHPTEAKNAIDEWQALTPLRFRPRIGSDTNWIQFENQGPRPLTSWSEGIGMQGGMQVIRIQDKKLDGSEGDPDAIQGTIVHEVGHAIGLFHEHTRPDRGEFLTFNENCPGGIVDSWIDLTNSGINPDGLILGPYDYDSVMHYSSKKRETVNGEDCYNFVRSDNGEPVRNSRHPSREDVNSVWWMYGVRGGHNEAFERFGATILRHDFDGDGYEDVAVAAPEDFAGTTTAGGAVYLYKNTATGFVFWKRVRPDSAEVGAEFGGALAGGNFDGDGTTELAVGSPGRTVLGKINAGAVFIYRIDANANWDLTRVITKDDSLFGEVVESHDRFGHSLAAGRFYSQNRTVLAVGAPGSRAPSEEGRGGDVFNLVLYNGMVNLHRLQQADGEKARVGQFGWAMTTMPSGEPNRDSLIVSAPGGTSGCSTRRVFLFEPYPGAAWPMVLADTVTGPVASPTTGYCLTGHGLCGLSSNFCPQPIAADEYPTLYQGFGAALAAGDFADDGYVDGLWDLAVGVPAPQGQGGSVMVYSRPSSEFLQLQYEHTLSNPGDSGTFGLSLAAGDVGGNEGDDLVVGVADADSDTDVESGWGYVYFGRGFATYFSPLETEPAFGLSDFDNESGDHCGASVAVVDRAGTPLVIAGCPGEAPVSDPAAGVFYEWAPDGSAIVSAQRRVTQETKSPHSP